MKIQVGIQVRGVEVLHPFGMLGSNVAVAHVFADDRSILAFY